MYQKRINCLGFILNMEEGGGVGIKSWFYIIFNDSGVQRGSFQNTANPYLSLSVCTVCWNGLKKIQWSKLRKIISLSGYSSVPKGGSTVPLPGSVPSVLAAPHPQDLFASFEHVFTLLPGSESPDFHTFSLFTHAFHSKFCLCRKKSFARDTSEDPQTRPEERTGLMD